MSETIPANPRELTYGEQLAQLIMAEPKGLCRGKFVDAQGDLVRILDPQGTSYISVHDTTL